jgi:predicted DNA-binding transcriptional regulator YafY
LRLSYYQYKLYLGHYWPYTENKEEKMYSPTMRLLTVIELLESYSSVSGSELASRLEVDKRTVRRYVVTLQDMGIPVTAERGPYGAYRLERGSRLPPLIFNDSEASAIILGLIAMRQMKFPIDYTAVEGALAKTERLLPEKLLGYVDDLKELIKIHSSSYFSATQIPHNDFVLLLGQAIRKRMRTVLTYSSLRGEQTVREVDLYGLVFVAGQWYAAGYCHLRKDLRTFRLDRLLSVNQTNQGFNRPENFDLLNYVLGSIKQVQKGFEVEIVLKTSIERARSLLPSEIDFLEETNEGVLYKQSTSRLDWLAFSLMNLDIPFIIRKPSELYDVFREISYKAARIASQDR